MDIQLTKEMSEKVLKNQRLVCYLLKKIGVSQNDYEDLFQIGMIGLIKATATFDESKDIQFSTYASICINNELKMHFRKNNKHLSNVSLNSIVCETKDGVELLLEDTIADSSSLDFIDKVENAETLKSAISIILNSFSMRETLILLFSIGGFSQKEIAERLCISQSYVSRLEKKLHSQVREFINSSKTPFRKTFSVSFINGKVIITFCTKDIEKFNEALEKAKSCGMSPKMKIMCTNAKTLMHFPAEPDCFAFLANILYEAETYRVEFIQEYNT